MDLPRKWNEHLRRESHRFKSQHGGNNNNNSNANRNANAKLDLVCPLCRRAIPPAPPDPQIGLEAAARAGFDQHLAESHSQVLDGKTSHEERLAWLQAQFEAACSQSLAEREGTSAAEDGQPPLRPSSRRKQHVGPDDRPGKSPPPKRESSGEARSVSPPKRSRARVAAFAAASPADDSRADFDRGFFQKGKLWDPEDAPPPRPYDKSNVATYHRQRPSSGSVAKPHRLSSAAPVRGPGGLAPQPADNDATEIIKQPETRPISQEQLVAEVKGIYAGLVMVESKCIEVDNTQSSQNDPANKLNNDQWQALIALHRTLLHEHHDFFLASQHPSASPALRRLASKYAMPARMWRHGIHSFLELLRHRLPSSLDHMLTFIYMAYSMMALLYETVPAFEHTWVECLGDLGRYRMAIEDDDIRDREVWTAVSRHWYSRASDMAPTTGRLYHHLAILARPNALQQLSYYTKSLCVEIPFPSASESIMTLFEPILSRVQNAQQARLPPTELNFVRAHGILFSGKQQEDLEPAMVTFLQSLDHHIGRSTRRWLEPGYHMAISNICAVTGYGDGSNPIAQALKVTSCAADVELQDESMQDTTAGSEDCNSSSNSSSSGGGGSGGIKRSTSNKQFPEALRLFHGTYDIVCRRFGDPNILPFLHVTLVFVYHLTFIPEAIAHLESSFSWKLTASFLNTLVSSFPFVSSASSASSHYVTLARLLGKEDSGELVFPGSGKEDDMQGQQEEGKTPPERKEEGKRDGGGKRRDDKADGKTDPGAVPHRPPRRRPLPDDFAMRGFPWVDRYFPEGWFATEERIDDDDKYFEVPSMYEERRERLVWLGRRIAARESGKWLRYDPETKRFGVNPMYEVDLNLDMPTPATPGESVDYGELPDAGVIA